MTPGTSKGAVGQATVWRIEFDDYFMLWHVTDGDTGFRCDFETDADWLRDLLTSYEELRAQRDALKADEARVELAKSN